MIKMVLKQKMKKQQRINRITHRSSASLKNKTRKKLKKKKILKNSKNYFKQKVQKFIKKIMNNQFKKYNKK